MRSDAESVEDSDVGLTCGTMHIDFEDLVWVASEVSLPRVAEQSGLEVSISGESLASADLWRMHELDAQVQVAQQSFANEFCWA